MDLKDKEKKARLIWKNQTFCESLRHAWDGIVAVFKDERNFRFDVFSLILVVIMGIWLQVSMMEWLWLLLASFVVLISEVWNTAIENVVDLATCYERRPLAKKAKDMAAGAVLLSAFFALIVAGIIFVPKLWGILF